MTTDRILILAAMGVTMLAGLLSLAYAVTDQIRSTKKPFRFFAAMSFFWMFSVYLQAWVLCTSPVPMAARTGFTALACLYIAEIIIDWRRKG